MLGFTFRGSRVSEFLSARVKMAFTRLLLVDLSRYARGRASSGSVKTLKAESTICRSARARVVRRQEDGS